MAEVRFGYDRSFVDQLKTAIPVSCRAWNPETRCWIVIPPYVERAESLLRRRFGTIDQFWEEAPTAPPDPIRSTDCNYAILHLLPSAPPELIESAYRCLSKRCHPDTGGDHMDMLQLNEAITRLRQRRGVA